MNNNHNISKPRLFISLYLAAVIIIAIVAIFVNARQNTTSDTAKKTGQSNKDDSGSNSQSPSKIIRTSKNWQIIEQAGYRGGESEIEILHNGRIAASGTSLTTDNACAVGAPFNIVSYFDEDKDNRMSNAPIICGLSNLNDDFSEKDIALIKSTLENYYAQQNMSKIIYKLVYINENDYVERDGSVTSYNYTMTVNNTDSNKLQITYYSNISFAIRAGKSDNNLTTIYSKNWR